MIQNDPRFRIAETEQRFGIDAEQLNAGDPNAAKAKGRILINVVLSAMIALGILFACSRMGEAVSPAQNTATCTVQANKLNLRAGPGTNYRSDALLNKGTSLRATGRNSASTWIKVTVTATSKQGWVAYGPQLATCSSAISRLSVATAPPATGANAATTNPSPNPNPVPEPIALVVLPSGGGGTEDLKGNLVTDQSNTRLVPDPNSPDNPKTIVFSDRLSLALDLTTLPRTGPISYVSFSLVEWESGEEVWFDTIEDTEALKNDPYCFFGGGDDCVEVDLRAGATWPNSNIPVTNGLYSFSMSAENTTTDPEDIGASRNWFGTIRIDSPRIASGSTSSGGNTSSTEPTAVPPVADQDPVIEFFETAPGTTDINIFEALTFQVVAYDPDVGTGNGDGIEYLYMDLNDPEGNVVAWAEYTEPFFCGFGGDENGCFTWWFADNDYTWPNGASIEYGNYTLYVDAVGFDGSETEATMDVILQ